MSCDICKSRHFSINISDSRVGWYDTKINITKMSIRWRYKRLLLLPAATSSARHHYFTIAIIKSTTAVHTNCHHRTCIDYRSVCARRAKCLCTL